MPDSDEREAGAEDEAASVCGSGAHLAAVEVDAFANADEAVAEAVGGGRAAAVVANVDPDLVGLVADDDVGVGGVGVLECVRQPFLAEMAERGEVSLDEPVDALLPSGVRVPTRDGRRITLLHLATNTSGLPRLPTNMHTHDSGNPYAEYTLAELYEFLATFELSREIGVQYEYSNLGFGLLGQALAARARRTYEELVLERVLLPLGMHSTRIGPTDEMMRRFALPHDEAGRVVSRWELPALVGAGSFSASVDDVIRFARANIFPPDSPLGRAIAATHAPRHAVTSTRSVGLAWHTDRVFGADLVWINGQTGGSHGFVGLDAGGRRGVVVLTNSVASVDDLGFHLLDTRYELAPGDERRAIVLPPSTLNRYVGVYQLAPAGTVTITRTDDGLFADASGLGSAAIYATSETEFFVKVVPIRLSFDLDPAGTVVGLTLHHGTRSQHAIRTAPASSPAGRS